MRTGVWNRAALPQIPNQRKTWKPEALIADTKVKAAYGFACWYARRSYDCSYVSKGGFMVWRAGVLGGPVIL